jgi:glycosyltransferase involved in cell wall biosynthesis
VAIKNVLIIGYLHPYTLPGGSFRLVPLARNLPEFGWDPVVLTPFLLDKAETPFRIVETGYRDALEFWRGLFRLGKDEDMKREVQDRLGAASRSRMVEFLFNRIGEVVNYPDSHRGWKPFALKAGRELLRKEKIDAVISCHPTISHVIASELKGEFSFPWVADLPDLWSLNHNYQYSPLRRWIDRRLELRTLSGANAMTTVSEPWTEKQRELHKGKPVYMITHGIDMAEVNEPPVELTKKFTITYTGTIYPDGQDTSKFFTALQTLISSGEIDRDNIEVRFYGRHYSWLDKEIEKYGLSSIAKQYGHLTMPEAVKKQRESQLLLLFKWEDPKERGWHSGKIYEYLAARRFILATGGSDDVIKELIDETGAGICAYSVKETEQALRELYQEYAQRGAITYHGAASKLDKYSHREMARKFAEVLDQVRGD